MNIFFLYTFIITSFNNSRASSESQNDRYCNFRYHYCLEYPKKLVYPGNESQNGDGKIFTTKSKDEAIRVWGFMNQDLNGTTLSLKMQFELDKQSVLKNGGTITYELLKDSYFILSGYRVNKRFYQKTLLKDRAFATAITSTEHLSNREFEEISRVIKKGFE